MPKGTVCSSAHFLVPGNAGDGWSLPDANISDQSSTSDLADADSSCRSWRVSSPAARVKPVTEQLIKPAVYCEARARSRHGFTHSHIPPSRLRDSLLLAERVKRGAGRSIMELAWRVWAWVRPLYRNLEPKTRKRRDEGGSTVETLSRRLKNYK